MNQIVFYSVGSSVLVSLIALIGILTLSIQPKRLERWLILLVSFSVGALLGDSFIHILPEVFEEFGFGPKIGLALLAGILSFFVLEKFINWHHCHNPSDSHHKSFVFTNLFGDMLHNFIDGVMIASAYLVDIHLGMAVTLAIVLHEVPQELGDFGILVHGGMSRWKALKLNFLSALFAVIGVAVGLLLGEGHEGFLPFILPFTAGGFIYVAMTDLFPELHKRSEAGTHSFLQLLLILAGIGVMMSLLLIEVGH